MSASVHLDMIPAIKSYTAQLASMPTEQNTLLPVSENSKYSFIFQTPGT